MNDVGSVQAGSCGLEVGRHGPASLKFVYGVGGGHNDMLVALSVAGAFAMLVKARDEIDPRRRWWEVGAVGVLTLGCLVKVSIAPALVIAVVSTVAARPRAERARLLAWQIGLAAALTVALAAPFWQTHDPSLGLSSLVSHRDWISPVRFLLASLGGLADLIGGGTARSVVEVLIRIGFAAAGVWAVVVVTVMVARRATNRGSEDGNPPQTLFADGAAWAWVLLVYVLVSPVVLPWYAAWVLPVAWMLPRSGRFATIGVSVKPGTTPRGSRAQWW